MTMKTITFAIVGMHCTSCALNIDFELEDLEGVTKSQTNYAKSKGIVEFDPDKITTQKIIQTVASLGYEAVPSTP